MARIKRLIFPIPSRAISIKQRYAIAYCIICFIKKLMIILTINLSTIPILAVLIKERTGQFAVLPILPGKFPVMTSGQSGF